MYAPATVGEMFSMTRAAFDATFRFRTPACVLADAFIGQMMETIELPDDLPDLTEVAQHRYPLENGIDGTAQTYGRIVSSLQLVHSALHAQNDERFADYEEISRILPEFELDGVSDSDIVVVAFGICARIALDAVRKARNNGVCVSMFRPKTLWPFAENALLENTRKARKIVVVECNRGMMQCDIERMIGRDRVVGVHTDGGLIPSIDDILDVL